MTQKEILQLKRDYVRLHDACLKVMDLYAKAPGGWASPEPTTKLVWGMYQAALKAVNKVETPARRR